MTAIQTTTEKMTAIVDGAIGRMVFNNPVRLNAVSTEMWQAAGDIMEAFNADENIRVVVVSGAGRKAFISGADISEFEDARADAAAAETYDAVNVRAEQVLAQVRMPTIAMIRGYCIGGGVGVAISCDLRICSDNARFAIPAARLGLGYDYAGIKKLVDLVGPSFAKEIFFTGRQFSAAEALDMKLVDRVVPDAMLEAYVDDYATTIAGNAPMTIRAVKRAVIENAKDAAERDDALCERMVDDCHDSADYAEGRAAFMEKRKPVFQGR